MTKEDIDSIIGDNKVTSSHVTISQVARIMAYVIPHIQVNPGTLDYYYTISVEDLIESQMPLQDLEELGNQGWAYDEGKKNIIIYLTV